MRALAIPALIAFALTCACSSGSRPLASPELEAFPRRITFNHNYQLFRVSNGMTVAMVPEAKTNLVGVDVRYRVGAADDPPGKDGMAHFVEHLLFQVAESEAPVINDQLGEVALFFNAYTNYDETHYTALAAKPSLERLLEIEAQRMAATCDAISDERIERERQVVKREIAERAGIAVDLRATLSAAVFADGHPYRRAVAGTAASIDSITREDVCAFLAAHYGPNRALLVVSGNIDVAPTQQLVGQTFGPIAKRASAAQAAIRPLSLTGTRSEHRFAISEPALAIAFSNPPWGTAPSMDQGLLLRLLEYQLGQTLDEDDGITAIASGSIGGFRGGASVLLIGLDDTGRADAVTAAVFKEAATMFDQLEPLVLEIIKAQYRSSIVSRHEPFARRASNVADYLQYTDHNRFLLKDLERVHEMTAERLGIAAESLRQTQTHVALIRPEKSAARRKRADLAAPGKDFDLDPWRVPVDAADASRPAARKVSRPARALERFELANGLEVVLAPGFEYPTVDIRFVIPAGTSHEPAGKRGVARLAAALLDDDYNAIERRQDALDFREIAKMGGSVSTSVFEDYTAFSIRGLSLFADGLLWQLYFRINSGTYDEKQFAALVKAAREIKPADDRDETGAIRAALFGDNHPYAAPRLARSILNLERGDLERFRDRHYHARGSTLIVTGRFDPAAMKARIERLFGAWSGERPARPAPSIPAASGRGSSAFAVADESRVQPAIIIAYPIGNGFVGKQAQRMIVRELLEQRLAAIREKLGASYGVSVSLDQARGPGLLAISGDVEPARAAEALVAIRAEIAAVRGGGEAIAADFVRARRRVLEQLLADAADAGSVAGELEAIAAFDLGADYFTDIARRAAQMTAADLAALVAAELPADREVVVLRGPAALTRSMFAAAQIKSVASID
jgi:zinc protease